MFLTLKIRSRFTSLLRPVALLFLMLAIVPSTAEATSCFQGPYIGFFEQNVSIMNRDARQVADHFLDSAGDCGYSVAVVIGHADTTEDIAIANERGEIVASYLTAHGIPQKYIIVSTAGSSQPRVINRTGKPQPQNRRVEIVWRNFVADPLAR